MFLPAQASLGDSDDLGFSFPQDGIRKESIPFPACRDSVDRHGIA
jgi:hypothetical protein